MTLTENNMQTLAAIMDDLAERAVLKNDDKVHAVIEKYREAHGSMEYRQVIINFAINTDVFLDMLDSDIRETIFDVYTWDFEWLPELMNRLQDTGINWYEAGIESITNANAFLMQDAKTKSEQVRG